MNVFIRFTIDTDAQFEESNGEARPLTAAEYAGNEYRACPNHPRGPKDHDRVENGRAWCAQCGTEYTDVPYTEYLAYYGNPDRHLYIGIESAYDCACCHSRVSADSLWNIDLMDDSTEARALVLDRWMPADQAIALPGYLGELATEYAETARMKAQHATTK